MLYTVITCSGIGWLVLPSSSLISLLIPFPACSEGALWGPSTNSQVQLRTTQSEALGKFSLAKTLLSLFSFSCFLVNIHWILNSLGNNGYIHSIFNKWTEWSFWQQLDMKKQGIGGMGFVLRILWLPVVLVLLSQRKRKGGNLLNSLPLKIWFNC